MVHFLVVIMDVTLLFLQVRQVEYKDKMEDEWEMFQRAMKEENQVSNRSFYLLSLPI